MGDMTQLIVERLHNAELIKKARLHPIKILAALTTYQSGKSVRGDATWTPVQAIVDALNEAFYLSFGNVEPTGKRILLAVDTSYSMHGTKVNGIPNLKAHTAAGAMALVIANSEWGNNASGLQIPQYHIIGVDTSVQELSISPKQRLDDVVRTLESQGGGGTDLSLPMQYALRKKLEVDAFVIATDSESWAGRGHPSQLLEQYRREINKNARIINIQMAATHVTNNDPGDSLALECIGFDTTTPEVCSAFIHGEF